MLENCELQHLLSRAYIIGGSPCSGKSTIAEMLAAQHALHYYKADDHDVRHMRQADPERQPVMHKFSKLSWDEIWSESPEQQCSDELAYYRERFPFILEDLAQLDVEQPVVLEGAAFLPDLINPLQVRQENVVFIVPTLEFQLDHYSQRPFIHNILKECHDPQQAFENWMQRDHLFSLQVRRRAEECGYRVLLVDGSVNIEAQLEIVRAHFHLE